MDRRIAGLRCRDLLSLLTDYVDGELETREVARVHAHLSGCDRCEKFGREYGAVVGALRKHRDPIPVGAAVRERLALALEKEWAAGGD